MANANFRVRHGLDIGDNITITDAGVASGIGTIDNALEINGGLTVDGSIGEADSTASIGFTPTSIEITGPLGIVDYIYSVSTDLTLAAYTTNNINLNADTVRVGDQNANATITSWGTGDLILNTNGGTNSGSITIADGLNGDITIDPDGTGKVIIAGDLQVDGTTTTINSTTLDVDDINITIGKGSPNAAASDGGGITLEGPTTPATMLYEADDDSWNFNKKTTAPELQVDNININGNTIISTDTNGNITLDPNGTGNVAMTLANGGNLTNTHNYVLGAIRNATTQSNGNIWAINQSTNTLPYKGISIDNSANTAVGSAFLTRQYSNTAAFPGRVVFERARGTAASPVTLNSGDAIGGMNFTGYTTTGWFNDTISATPGLIQMTTAENWVSNTNLGTTFVVINAPTATTISSAANTITTIAHNPQTATYRSDAFTFRQGKTGTTDLMTINSSGDVTITGDLRINGNDIKDSVGDTVIQLGQNGGDDIFFRAQRFSIFDTNSNSKSNMIFVPGDSQGANAGERITQFSLFMTQETGAGANETARSSYYTAPYDTGTTNYTPTQSGNTMAQIAFGGNSTTAASPSYVETVFIKGRAAENYTGSAQGGRFAVEANKVGTTTLYDAFVIDSANAYISSDEITFEDSSSVLLTSDKLNYTRTYGEFAYTNAAGFDIPAQNTVYTMPLDTTLLNSGITISGTGTINVDVAGYYKIIMSLQARMTTNNIGSFVFWLRKNGTDVANSKTEVDLLKDQKSVIAMDWLVNSDGDDEFEIVYASGSANYGDIDFPTIAATTVGVEGYDSPVAPALIVNVIPAGA